MVYARKSGLSNMSPGLGVVTDNEASQEPVLNKLEELMRALQEGARAVICPHTPEVVPGIAAGAIYTAADCVGTVFTIRAPKRGIIQSATYYDMDDEGSQMDFAVFSHTIANAGDNNPFAPTDSELLSFVTVLQFATFVDHGTAQTAELVNIGKAYLAEEGYLYIQAIDRATKTIAAGNLPRLKLQILSGDPEFKEY